MRKEIFGWVMYDWANSAYILTISTALLPAYFATVVIPPEGIQLFGTTFSSSALWGFMVSFAALLVFLSAPALGAIADSRGWIKRFLATFCVSGAVAAFLLSFAERGDFFWVATFFIIAQFGFAAANVFYDAYLPHLVPKDKLDHISGKGFAYGYIGGGLQFLLALLLILGHEWIGISQSLAARAGMAMAAVWWLGFALFSFSRLPEPVSGKRDTAAPPSGLIRFGFRKFFESLKQLVSSRSAGLFLLAYFFYNDGIHTVISMATIYGKEELRLPLSALMLTLLIIQFVAFGGSLLFSRLAERITAKRALLLALFVWSGIVLYAYFITTVWEYFILGIGVGLVMGGSQALSRSLFASVIPKHASAQYFGYFSILAKFSAVGGPFVFGMARHLTGSARTAVLTILFFFLVGMVLLWKVDTRVMAESAE